MKKILRQIPTVVFEWTVNALVLIFGMSSVVQGFVVPTSSMESTVMTGDHMFVDRVSYSPSGSIGSHLLPYTDVKRGDIIVFRFPPDIRQSYIKRVMGLPGDRIRIENKIVYLNGHPLLNEPYTQHIFPGLEPYRDTFPATPYGIEGKYAERVAEMLTHVDLATGELVVPEGKYFAMGDNRDNSSDSRYWGWVPRENIYGKPFIIWWSYDAPTSDWLDYSAEHYGDLALHFFSKTRWDRSLKLVRGVEIK
jgi:signal peptidase I